MLDRTLAVKRIYYCYLIIDAEQLVLLINSLEDKSWNIEACDLENFKQIIIYIGKGCCNRKMMHLVEAKNILSAGIKQGYNGVKIDRILNIWKRGGGIIALQIFSDSDNYISMAREYAMIKAAKNYIANIYNGAMYGPMINDWTDQEIRNFGDMLLYFAFKQCILEQPSPIFPSSIKKK